MEVKTTTLRVKRLSSEDDQVERESSKTYPSTNVRSRTSSDNYSDLDERRRRPLPDGFTTAGVMTKHLFSVLPTTSTPKSHPPAFISTNTSDKYAGFVSGLLATAQQQNNRSDDVPAPINDLGSSDSAFDLGADRFGDMNLDDTDSDGARHVAAVPGGVDDGEHDKDWLKTPVKISVPVDDDADDEAAEYLNDVTLSALLATEQIAAVGQNVQQDQRLVKLLQNKLKTQVYRAQTARRQSLIKRERLRHHLKEALSALEAEQLRSRTLQSKLDDECNNLRTAHTEITQLAARMQTFESHEQQLRKRIELVKESVDDAVPCVTNEEEYVNLRQLKRSQLTLKQLIALKIYEDTRQLRIELQSAKKSLREIQATYAGFAAERCSLTEHSREQDQRVQVLNAELHAARAQLHTDDRRLNGYDQLVAERDAYAAKNDEYKNLIVDLQPKYETMLAEMGESRSELDGARQRIRLLQEELEYMRSQCATFKASTARLETLQKSDQDTISRLRAQIDDYQVKYIDGSSSARAEYDRKLTARLAEVQQAVEKQLNATRKHEQRHYERELEQRDREMASLRDDVERLRNTADEERAKRESMEEKLRQAVERYNWDVSQLEAELGRVRIELSTAQLQAEELLESDSRAREAVEEVTRRAVELNTEHTAYRQRIETELIQLQTKQQKQQPDTNKYVGKKYAELESGLERKFQTLVDTIQKQQSSQQKTKDNDDAKKHAALLQQQRLAMLNEAAAEVVHLKSEVKRAMARKQHHQQQQSSLATTNGESPSHADGKLLNEIHGLGRKSDEAFSKIILVGSRVPSGNRQGSETAANVKQNNLHKPSETSGAVDERRRQSSANSPPFHRPPPKSDSTAKRRVNSATEDGSRRSPVTVDSGKKRRSSSKSRIDDKLQTDEKQNQREQSTRASSGRHRSDSLSSSSAMSDSNCWKLFKESSSTKQQRNSRVSRQSSAVENIPSALREAPRQQSVRASSQNRPQGNRTASTIVATRDASDDDGGTETD